MDSTRSKEKEEKRRKTKVSVFFGKCGMSSTINPTNTSCCVKKHMLRQLDCFSLLPTGDTHQRRRKPSSVFSEGRENQRAPSVPENRRFLCPRCSDSFPREWFLHFPPTFFPFPKWGLSLHAPYASAIPNSNLLVQFFLKKSIVYRTVRTGKP
jgi:hypothetical protein